MTKSATGAGVSVSVELLLPGVGSVVPAGGVTVAVLTRFPVAEASTVPLTVKTTELPAPAGTLTVAARLLPDPLPPLLMLAPPVTLLVQVTLVKFAGSVSATIAPTALLGPLLVTVIVYVSGLPGV
jgi:hypothetical protein